MIKRALITLLGAFLAIASLASLPGLGQDYDWPQHSMVPDKQEEIPVLKPAGKKNELPGGRYFTWEFSQTPKMGTVILRLEVFDQKGGKITSLKVGGRSDMPSMRGHHDSGEVAFKLNNQGVYLLPVNIVMPGDWEIILTFRDGDNVLYRGRILFRV
ncbi:MAG: FixH family protein [Candidatus Saccharicenans sp.]|nr:FixH family protein [Candidatus Saccharicenans sp.]